MMKPYNYQADCLHEIEQVRQTKQALVVMATGLGKTVTAAFDFRAFVAQKPDARCLYLTHDTEIIGWPQAAGTFLDVLGCGSDEIGFFIGGNTQPDRKIVFASLQMMHRHMRKIFKADDFDYIIFDECHHSQARTFKQVLTYFKQYHFRLGLTGTPWRDDGLDITKLFGQPVYELYVEEAIAAGLLANVEYRLILDDIDSKLRQLKQKGASIAKLNRTLFVKHRDRVIVQTVKQKIREAGITEPRVGYFTDSIAHSNRLAKVDPDLVPMNSSLSKGRNRTRMSKFRQGDIKHLVTVGMMNEGRDVPEMNVIVFLNNTTSYKIFLQQLGRGLRPVKEKLLVLDFVGSIQRINMVHSLVEKIAEIRQQLETDETGPKPRTATEITLGNFMFSDVPLDLLKLMRQARTGYTKEELIRQIHSEAKLLGRMPRSDDMNRASAEGRAAHTYTFEKVFGSWIKALLEAGYEEPQYLYTESDLIKQLQAEAEFLGQTTLSSQDIQNAHTAGRTATQGTFSRRFGSWNKALLAADLEISRSHYEDEELIQAIKQEAKHLGRTPTKKDVDSAHQSGRMAHSSTYVARFGSWTHVVSIANLKPLRRIGLTKEEMIYDLRAEAKRLNRVPMRREIGKASKAGRTASPSTYAIKFGSWNNALIAAELIQNKQVGLSKLEIVRQLKAEYHRLDRVPTVNDINAASAAGRSVSVSTILNRFGSWSNALEAADLESSHQTAYSDAEMLESLKIEAELLGRTPTHADIGRASKAGRTPSAGAYKNHFGSLTKACEMVGLTRTRFVGLSDEEVLTGLKAEAERLRRRPTVSDIRKASKAGRTVSLSTLTSRFGSLSKALKAAGL